MPRRFRYCATERARRGFPRGRLPRERMAWFLCCFQRRTWTAFARSQTQRKRSSGTAHSIDRRSFQLLSVPVPLSSVAGRRPDVPATKRFCEPSKEIALGSLKISGKGRLARDQPRQLRKGDGKPGEADHRQQNFPGCERVGQKTQFLPA